jgi:hypothetical protein
VLDDHLDDSLTSEGNPLRSEITAGVRWDFGDY